MYRLTTLSAVDVPVCSCKSPIRAEGRNARLANEGKTETLLGRGRAALRELSVRFTGTPPIIPIAGLIGTTVRRVSVSIVLLLVGVTDPGRCSCIVDDDAPVDCDKMAVEDPVCCEDTHELPV